MRIPTSAIVMVLAVSVPLTFAIRDSMNGDDDESPSLSERYDRDLAEAAVQREAAQAEIDLRAAERERERERAAQDERAAADRKRASGLAVLHALVADKPASLGAAFAGLRVGAPLQASASDAARTRIRALDPESSIDLRIDADAQKLDAIDVTFSSLSRNECATALVERWGGEGDDGVWLDASTHTRVVVDGTLETCTLHFDAYEQAATWVAKLPLNALDTAAKKLALDPSASIHDDVIAWRGPGVGAGHQATNYTLSLDDGKVVQIFIYSDADAASLDAIRTALAARLHAQPTRHEDGNNIHYAWTGHVRVTLSQDGTSFSITIGSEPR